MTKRKSMQVRDVHDLSKRTAIGGLIGCVVFNGCLSMCVGQELTKSNKPRTVTRLFWQDTSDQSLQCGDMVRMGTEWTVKKHAVSGLAKLDDEKQSMVQMAAANGVVFAGIHDNDNGNLQSGWIAVNAGVTEEEHGNHSHWHFDKEPSVLASQLDANQGNPAHIYEYQGEIFVANDKKNGFTVLSPSTLLRSRSSASSRFVSAGGGHITLAAVDKKVCYATWADRDGDNKGRVDVVGLSGSASKSGYTVHLPSGGLHGATSNSGKVFFAPSDGVFWVQADVALGKKPKEVEINHLSLGEDATTGKPLRTGAFENHNQYVLFTTGSADTSTLCLIDAKSAKPTLVKLSIPIESGLALTTPKCVSTGPAGKDYAFLFSDRRGSEIAESVYIVDLDPNNDGNYFDAKVAKCIPVGTSKIEGHGGHHEVCFVPGHRLAVITNPGDGSIWAISLTNLEVQVKVQVSGEPTRIVAVGG